MRVAPSKATTVSICLALIIGLFVYLCNGARAEQLPLKVYTTADGLPRDYIVRIIRDSHGFLRFCTPEGLSRFNGYDFVNYGIEQGLPSASVRDLLETHDGTYLIATGGGVALFNPVVSRQIKPTLDHQSPTTTASPPRFVIFRPSNNERAVSVNVLQEERAGVIWCGTDAGLYRLDRAQDIWIFSFVDIGLPTDNSELTGVSALLKDRRGALWIGSPSGLYRRLPDGRLEHYTTQQGLPFNDVRALHVQLSAGNQTSQHRVSLTSNLSATPGRSART
jgi:ligand-binding sensor domain-containing protein